MRLLAAVVAKNGVGSSWRKTIGSREWSRVPDSEKAFVRATVVELLFAEPRERVAIQLGLLIANMAKCVGSVTHFQMPPVDVDDTCRHTKAYKGIQRRSQGCCC